ncbi:unnamed protein product, partial [Notodromas monacha]
LQYLVEQFETVITWESVTFKGKNISDFPKCALPVSPADPNLLIGRQMICDSKGMSCTNVVGGAHVNYGFRPADKSGQAVIDDTVNIDTFEVLVAKKKKPTNPFKQMWSIFLPSAGRWFSFEPIALLCMIISSSRLFHLDVHLPDAREEPLLQIHGQWVQKSEQGMKSSSNMNIIARRGTTYRTRATRHSKNMANQDKNGIVKLKTLRTESKRPLGQVSLLRQPIMRHLSTISEIRDIETSPIIPKIRGTHWIEYDCHFEKDLRPYNVKILCQLGLRVLYSVWVCSLAFTSSSTQKGSLFPPRSAAASPWALNTLT